MEDDPTTNSGFGSTLTMDGMVECDASVMDGNGQFGAVGAVQGVRYTIELADKIMQESTKPLSANRVQPIFLVGEGARKFAIKHQLECCKDEELSTYQVTENSKLKRVNYYSSLVF
eukprot:TRINITY_DN86006_c0_g1_i1.p2 TRINITY_DN86006_c0_g1~~TRINITY_DN86006_c0_g1_i1.p2  ORF type:complete len:116 (+),score=16.36 TRINITY_DN86006_c0_g1_i1:1-348(+)